jgi:hypothetical protein
MTPRSIRLCTIVLTSILAMSMSLAAQTASAPQIAPAPPPLKGSIASHPDWPAAKPEDVQSVDAILAALYDVISGPKGKQRDWNRMRSLFIPDARLIPSRIDHDTQRADAIVLTIDGYIERSSGNMMANGFFEHSVHNVSEQFGNVVHVWSTYESRHNADDAKPFARGINSIQLLKSGDRYYIVNILWDAERPDNPIPTKYLSN